MGNAVVNAAPVAPPIVVMFSIAPKLKIALLWHVAAPSAGLQSCN
jgi:hypothetical protein